jgi:hypothetical protein
MLSAKPYNSEPAAAAEVAGLAHPSQALRLSNSSCAPANQ